MNLFALSPMQDTGAQIALSALLGVVGFYLLLPRPRGRFVPGGIAAVIASVCVFGAWLHTRFGRPMPDTIGTILFWMFSAGSLIFGTVLIVQRNPARGAIAFAFVILSTCGLFLLLAAPFLMAVTIIVYAGAIIVTFLFVLMLSQTEGPSDENDRTREPLYGSLAGFAFVGLVLFTLYETNQASGVTPPLDPIAKIHSRLPAQVLTPEEKKALADLVPRLETADAELSGDLSTSDERDKRLDYLKEIKNDLAKVVGQDQVLDIRRGSIRERLERQPTKPDEPFGLYREDQQARAVLEQTKRVRDLSNSIWKNAQTVLGASGPNPDVSRLKADLRKLRDEVVLLSGSSELPANNVSNIGFVLYSDHLLAVELAGTLLLVATIGAVAVAHRKGVAK